MRCKKAVKSLSEYLLGDISPRHEMLLEKHIDSCSACAESLAAYQELFTLISDSSIDGPTDLYFDSLPHKILSRIKSEELDSREIPFSQFHSWLKPVSVFATVVLTAIILFHTLPINTSTPSGALPDLTEIERSESYSGFVSSIEHSDEPLMLEHFDTSIIGTSDNAMWYSDADAVESILLFNDEEQEDIFNEIKENMS